MFEARVVKFGVLVDYVKC